MRNPVILEVAALFPCSMQAPDSHIRAVHAGAARASPAASSGGAEESAVPGTRLQSLRLAAGLSQEEPAEKLDVMRTTGARIGSGKRDLTVRDLVAYSRIVKMPMEATIFKDPPEERGPPLSDTAEAQSILKDRRTAAAAHRSGYPEDACCSQGLP